MAQTKQWKEAERRVAKICAGTRVSGPRGVKMQDVEHAVFSIEVKHGKTSIPKFVAAAYAQAKANAPVGKVPLVVLHTHGSHDYMAVLPLAELVALLCQAQAGAPLDPIDLAGLEEALV